MHEMLVLSLIIWIDSGQIFWSFIQWDLQGFTFFNYAKIQCIVRPLAKPCTLGEYQRHGHEVWL